MNNPTRIYNKKTAIDSNEVLQFYQERLKVKDEIKQVMLKDNHQSLKDAQERNVKERDKLHAKLKKHFGESFKLNVLDLGCGNGRWAQNLNDLDIIQTYDGVDFVAGFVDICKNKFKDDSRFQFFQMRLTDLDLNVLKKEYDLILMCGVLVYINDSDIPNILKTIDSLLKKGGVFYSEESVATIENRMTLKNFYSEELKTHYNAIYRTPSEYEALFGQYIRDIEIFGGGNSCSTRKLAPEPKPTWQHGALPNYELLLDEKTGAHKETNTAAWVFIR